MSDQNDHDSRRKFVRREMRMPGAAFALCDSDSLAIEVWTKDVSDDGALLVSHTELLGERILLDLPLSEYEDSLVVCNVRHRSKYNRILISGVEQTLYSCGVYFERVFAKADVHETLLAAFS